MAGYMPQVMFAVVPPSVLVPPIAAPVGIDIATEVQRMVECEGFKPLRLPDAESRLSPASSKYLIGNCLRLEQVLKLHPSLISLWSQDDGVLMVSVPSSPWLGANPKPPSEHGPTGPKQKENRDQVLTGILRGKALDIIEDLTNIPDLQESLRDIAAILLTSPDRTMLVSSLGNRISTKTRNFLRCAKLRTAQLLRCFSDDFLLEEKGAGTTVTYAKAAPQQYYVTPQQHQRIDSARHARLLKLATDVTMDFRQARGMSAGDLIEKLCKEGTNGMLLIDCRTESEQVISALPGAVQLYHVTAEHLQQAAFVVAYCCIGCRSAEWCQELSNSAVAHKLHFLKGGIAAWLHEGGQLIQPSTGMPCRLVHCWTFELVPFFPTRGCDVHRPELGVNAPSEIESSPQRSLTRASRARLDRLRNLAWEVRLRYCPSVLCLDAEEVQRLVAAPNAGYIFVDVRTPEERQVSTISSPTCPTITKEEFLQKMAGNLPNLPYTFLVFCTVGGRSGRFCQDMLTEPEKIGLRCKVNSSQLKSILGGIAGWVHVGGGLVDPFGNPTSKVSPWCQAFMDIFPVSGAELVLDELQVVPQDARAFIDCKSCAEMAAEVSAPGRILRTCQALAPEVLADTLYRAAETCAPYDD
ncbi:unnamed protein product [Symbiodinium necroappetens]|uniref:Rhodanese domain-containing protein n=1 Tax=Symbiodinium necroappetens TaxID=1628268 RepID=A0A813CGL0_9DINO|nr:unnamed protein product [Symbiodinium necroappetens]